LPLPMLDPVASCLRGPVFAVPGRDMAMAPARRLSRQIRLSIRVDWRLRLRCRGGSSAIRRRSYGGTQGRADFRLLCLCCRVRCRRVLCLRRDLVEAGRRRRNQRERLRNDLNGCRLLGAAPPMLAGGGTTCGVSPVPLDLASEPPAGRGWRRRDGLACKSPVAEPPQLSRSRLTCDGGGATTAGGWHRQLGS